MSIIKFPGWDSKDIPEGSDAPVAVEAKATDPMPPDPTPGPPLDENGEHKVYFVCRCGCTTFVLRPGYVIECANCKLLHNDGTMAAWQLDKEPDLLDRDIPDKPERKISVVDFTEGELSIQRIKRRLVADSTAFVIHVDNEGGVHTWGSIEGVKQSEWYARMLNTATRMLTNAEVEMVTDADDHVPDKVQAAAASVADTVLGLTTMRPLDSGQGDEDQPDMIDWLNQHATREDDL